MKIIILLIVLTTFLFTEQNISKKQEIDINISNSLNNKNLQMNSNIIKNNKIFSELKQINEKLTTLSSKDDTVIKYFLPILITILAGFLALFQVKANIISSARIEWAQNLRKVISSFLSEVMIINFTLRRTLDLHDDGKTDEAEKIYNQQTENFKKVYEYGNQIKLFLNNQEEPKHEELQKLINKYLEDSTHGWKSQKIDKLKDLEIEIIKKSQLLLKEAWEDAKTFKLRDVFKFKI